MTKLLNNGNPAFLYTRRLARIYRKVDGGQLLSRASLAIPVLAASHSQSIDSYSAFSRQYHIASFLSSIVLFGANEFFLLKHEALKRVGFLCIIITAFLCVSATAAATSFVANLSVVALLFMLLYRTLFMFFISSYRNDETTYISFSIALCASCALLSIFFNFYAIASIPLLAAGVFYVMREKPFTKLLVLRALRLYPAIMLRQAPFALNFLLTTMYVQGALFVLSFIGDDRSIAAGTNFSYLFNVAFILHGLIYRHTIYASARRAVKRSRVLMRALIISMALALAFVLVIILKGSQLEAALFGQSLLDGHARYMLASAVLLHASNYALGGALIGAGQIRRVILINVVVATLLTTTLLLLSRIHSHNALPIAVVVASATALTLRSIATLNLK